VGDRGAAAAGLLQASSLPFIVTASQIVIAIGALDRATELAFVVAGLVSALAFPALAMIVFQRRTDRGPDPTWREREMIVS
jgi:hypothetical protein